MSIYVITGATSGIGQELTRKLSVHNTVFAGFRRNECEEELKSISDNIIPFYINYDEPLSIKNAIEFIKGKTKEIDALFNVAGCVVAGAMENIELNDIKRQFEVNVFAPLEFTKGLLPILDNGKIINISSMASFGIFPFIAPYCASKRTLDILFNLMQLEFKKNIKTVSIKLGVIATPLWSKSIKENLKEFESSKEYSNEIRFMVKNAQKNEKKGTSVEKTVSAIIKINSKTNPKPSYTIGLDAKIAELFSHLPLAFINKIVKTRLEKECSL